MDADGNSRVRTTSLNRTRCTRAPQIDPTDIQLAENVEEAVDVHNEPDDLDNYALQMKRIVHAQSILLLILRRGYDLSTPSELYEAIEQARRVLLGVSLENVQQPMPPTSTRTDTLSCRRETKCIHV